MKLFFCVLLTFSFFQNNFGQSVENPKALDLKEGEKFVFKKIIELKDEVILIRLDKKQRRLAHLRRANGRDLANKIQLETQIQNDSIIAGSKAHLDFCPFFFFDLKDSKAVLDSQRYELVYDADGNEVDFDFSNRKIFVLTAPDSPPNVKTSLVGIVLRELNVVDGRQKLEIIKDPFPNFVKAKPHKDLFNNTRNWERAFFVFNENLEELYPEAIYYFPVSK